VTVDFEGKIDGDPFRRQGRGLPVPGRRRPDAQGVRRGRARHEVGESKTFPLAFPPTTTARTWPARRPTSWSPSRRSKPAPARSERSPGQVAGHCRRHGRRPARRHQEEPGARSQVPPAGPQQAGRDGRAGCQGRTGPAQRQRAGRNRAPARRRPCRPEAARHQGRRQGADSRRRVPPRPSAACAWAWWWPSWCVPTNCRPSPSNSRPTSTSWPPATRSPPTWCAGTSATASAWPKSKAVVIENNVTDFVLGKAKVTDKAVSFDELMGPRAEPGVPVPSMPDGAARSSQGLVLWCTSPNSFLGTVPA
jgi:hypothetical protein